MITNIKSLVDICSHELLTREYRDHYAGKICQYWNMLINWMETENITEFNENIGLSFCDKMIGTHLTGKHLSKQNKVFLRAIYMLISYQQDGEFSFRSPQVERRFEGSLGEIFDSYFRFAENELHLSHKTIHNKKRYLHDLYTFLCSTNTDISQIDTGMIQNLYLHFGYSDSEKHNCIHAFRGFFHFMSDTGRTDFDLSIYVQSDNYDRHSKIPTTYTQEEIRRIINSVDRASAAGKRDYLIVLLAAEYGWRSSDIVNLRFEEIDWDMNVIHIIQEKTGILSDFPLTASVGNAIIDYVKNGRPQSSESTVILCHESSRKGKKLHNSTIHSIVTRYMRAANIDNWQTKKHGAHALRHSVATNMLAKNTPLPVISAVLGHQTTETTKIYISLDEQKLKQCALDIPAMNSPHYGGGYE